MPDSATDQLSHQSMNKPNTTEDENRNRSLDSDFLEFMRSNSEEDNNFLGFVRNDNEQAHARMNERNRSQDDNTFLGLMKNDSNSSIYGYSSPPAEGNPLTGSMTARAPASSVTSISSSTGTNRAPASSVTSISSAGSRSDKSDTDVEMMVCHPIPERSERTAADFSPIPENRNPFSRLESGLGDEENNVGSLPRLVLRNRPFGQSNNKVNIQHNQGCVIYALLKHNWFHAFLRWTTCRSLLMLMFFWTLSILIFAVAYEWHDSIDPSMACGLGKVNEPVSFGTAFAFSLETCTTVGYGLPNGDNHFFEEECGSLQFLIYCQMAWSMLFNAFLLAFLYARFGRSEARSNQVINSRKALVSCVNGQVRFQVRMFDADAQHPVVEAHVRMYCVMNHRPVPRPLRLLQPDDDMGGMLFLSFPTVVSHHIDLYSLLHPPTDARYSTKPTGLVLRQVDGTTAGRDDVICPVCGESYGTLKRWKNHVRYQKIVEEQDEYPVEGTHLSLDLDDIERQYGIGMRPTTDLEELKDYFEKHVAEVICVVEGIDPLQSGTFQSLQSYRSEDIVWDDRSQFAPCMTIVNGRKYKKYGEQTFEVDLDRYHDIVLDTYEIREQQKRQDEEAKAALMLAVSSLEVPEGGLVECTKSVADIAAAASLALGDVQEKVKRRRHRRVRSSSNRPGDALFAPSVTDEIGRLSGKDKGHPIIGSRSRSASQSSVDGS